MPQTYVEVGNRPVFILDPRLTRLALLNSSCFFGKKNLCKRNSFSVTNGCTNLEKV